MIRTIPEEMLLTLAYNNLKPKAPLSQAKVSSITNKIGEFKTLQFSIPQVVFHNGKEIENPSFEKIQIEQLVLLNNYGYYVIKNVQRVEDSTGIKKIVSCVSIESKLAKKMIVLPHKVIQLKKNDLDEEEGIFDIMEQEIGWKLKYLDEKAQFDNINGGKALKYRNIEVNETWWNFLTVTLQEAFDIVVYFDHLDKTISVFDRASFGKDTKLILSRKNYLDSLSKTFDNTDLVTRMYVEGDEGVSINSVNPLGTSYIEDFSFFATPEYMSKELIDALDLYYPVLEQLQVLWLDENDVLLDLQKELITIESNLAKKTEELKAKKHLQTEALKDDNGNPDSATLKELKPVIDALEAEIENIKEEKANKEKEIEKQQEVLMDISSKMDKKTISINDEKIFTEETLEELDNFIMEGSWQNTYYTSDLTLYYGAKEQIKKVNKPTFDISVGLNQLALDVFQARTITSELYDLGDFVLVENAENSIKHKIKTFFHPLVKGSKKTYQINVEEDGRLSTKEKFAAIVDKMFITDVAGIHHEVSVSDNGGLITKQTGKRSDSIYRVQTESGKIYKITVGTNGALCLVDDGFTRESDFERVRIIGYTYNPETEATTLELSTKEFSLTQEGKISNALNSAINNGKVLEKNKLTLEQAKENFNWIENYYKNALDVAMKEIISSYGNNKITITENGILLQDARDLDNLVLLSCAGIIMSDDGLESVRTAITGSGIVAEELIGQVILGKQVYIADEKGELEIKGNLMTIYDNLKKARVKIGEYEEGIYGIEIRDAETGVVAINSKGSLQRERMTFCDNLDADFPYSFTVPLDAGLSEIRQCDLYLEPKKFRGYSRAVAGGGATVGTTAANSDQTSKPSSLTTSKVNINTAGSGQYGSGGNYGTGWGTGWGGNGSSQLRALNSGNHKHYIGYVSPTIRNGNVYDVNDDSKRIGIAKGYMLALMNGSSNAVNLTALGTPPVQSATILYTSDISPLSAFSLFAGLQTLEVDNEDEIQQLANKLYPRIRPEEEISRLQERNAKLFTAEEVEAIQDEEEWITEEEFHQTIVFAMARANASTHQHSDFDHYHSNQHAHNMDHTHTVSAHKHNVTLGDHEHEMIFGIWQDEETALPTVSIEGRVEGGMWQSIYKNINVKTKLDLKPFLDKVNRIGEDTLVEFRITSKTRARIEGSMLMKCMTRF